MSNKSSGSKILKVTAFVLLALLFTGVSAVYFTTFNWVTIYIEGEVHRRVTFARTVEEVLDEAGLALRQEDYVYPSKEQQLERGASIVVVKARLYVVNHDGVNSEVWSVGKKVADILQDAGVKWHEQDVVLPPAETPAEEDRAIAVVRVESQIIEEQMVLAHKEDRVPNPNMYRGQTRVTQTGRDGRLVNTIEITYHDGEETERKVLSSETVVESQNKIVEYGTISSISRGGYNIGITRVVDVLATAYCPGTPGTECPIDDRGWSACTGPYNTVYADGYNRTSTGRRAKEGSGTREDPYIIAVDPRLIPLNTLVYLTFSGGGVTTRHGRIITDGFAIAADVGSAIKGNRIDVLFDNHWVAWYFGHRQVRVFVVESVNRE